jgi:hypothetical protein
MRRNRCRSTVRASSNKRHLDDVTQPRVLTTSFASPQPFLWLMDGVNPWPRLCGASCISSQRPWPWHRPPSWPWSGGGHTAAQYGRERKDEGAHIAVRQEEQAALLLEP